MRKSEWSDKQLEDLLRQMPKIKDNRQPHEIYQSLSVKKENARAIKAYSNFGWLVKEEHQQTYVMHKFL